ncbi:MAG TPA: CPBP family intramembrane glutamic endopeptidase, partial [Gemmataceae bacterium]|nr:CPBP family intramembrane glutamic endopeptidase [Gemmataceae bacterium]
MDEVIPVFESDVPPEPPVRRRGHPLVAWGFIVVIVGVITWLQSFRSEERAVKTEERAGLRIMQMQGRSIVGISQFFPSPSSQQQIQTLNTGTVSRRLQAIILEGELAGPEKSQELLKDLDQKIELNAVQLNDQERRLKQILSKLYADYVDEKYDAPSLSVSDRDYLREKLGWFGELALAPAQGPHEARERVLAPARRTALVLLMAGGLGLMAAAAGFFGMIFLLIFYYMGHLRRGLETGIPYGGLYAETFAVWMALFLGLEFVVGIFAGEKYRFALLGLAMLSSLMALAWPVFRGVPWRQVREDVGWTSGRWPILEPLFGPAGYAMTLPMLGIGILMMTVFMGFKNALSPINPDDYFGPVEQPSHPVMEDLLTGNWLRIVHVIVIAAIVAPIVEETMFRGVLYRHLREATARWGVTA